ncbi:MAG TPA: carbon-nitrogen hydrolase family protein [Bacteroidota bacterium]|nr:carbon-nitrogen hydrolase family protein [Bacteroidota bacterium]
MRNVRIGTTAFLVEDSHHTIDMNIGRAVGYIALAKEQGADILCLPEMVTTANVPRDMEYDAEEYPGAVTAAFRRAARAHKINIIAPYLVRSGKKIFNQATVIDRRGKIVGFYRKVQPTAEESRHVTPGNELPVFEMDFGRIAVMICMDIYFPEIPRIYAFKGAEVLFWPTVSHGPTQEALRTQLTARAVDNSLIVAEANLANHPPYAAYAGRYRPATARIIDHNGDILAQTGRRHGVATATVDLDEVRLTSQCVLIREPDRMREDLESITRLDLYAKEYAQLSRKQKRYY